MFFRDDIERILGHFAHRRIVLIGDSGEYDPELFADILLRHTDQVSSIRIRDVVNAAEEQPARLHGKTVISPDGEICG